jgi:hypothetical protein
MRCAWAPTHCTCDGGRRLRTFTRKWSTVSAMVKRAPAQRHPRKAKPGTKCIGPAECPHRSCGRGCRGLDHIARLLLLPDTARPHPLAAPSNCEGLLTNLVSDAKGLTRPVLALPRILRCWRFSRVPLHFSHPNSSRLIPSPKDISIRCQLSLKV